MEMMKVSLQMAGCGRLKGPSGVTVTPRRMKADRLATRPLEVASGRGRKGRENAI